MKVNKVKFDNITTITFDISNFITFENDKVFRQPSIFDKIAGKTQQTLLNISKLLSMLFLVCTRSIYICL